MNKYISVSLLLLTGWVTSATAQNDPGFYLAQYSGILVKHSPKLTNQTGQTVWAQEIGFNWYTNGQKHWQQAWKLPVWGIAAMRTPMGEGSHGTGWAIIPNVSLPLYQRNRVNLDFRIGVGAVYVEKPHDSFKNPTQNALGSHWNECVQLRWGARYQVNSFWIAEAGAVLTHFSNGGFELPNFGVNIPGGYASVAYRLRRSTPNPAQKSAPLPPLPASRWGLRLNIGAARSEYITFDGPKYTIWAASTSVTRQFGRYRRAGLGFDYEFNAAVYAWGLRSTSFASTEAARKGATRLAITAAYEWQIGPLGIWLQPALHIGPADFNQIRLGRYYNKLSLNYYLPTARHGAQRRLYAGVTLKAYKAVAEYFGLNLGYQLPL